MKTCLNTSLPVDGVAVVSCYSVFTSFFPPPLLLPNENVMSCSENLEPCLANLCIISSTQQNTNVISSRLSFETGLSVRLMGANKLRDNYLQTCVQYA